MSEVGFTQVQATAVTRISASTKGAAVADEAQGGKSLPMPAPVATPVPTEVAGKVVAIDPAKATHDAEEGDLDSVVASVNDYVQSIERDLHFTVDAELDKTVIKVIDSDSGDVIRQIPEDVFLELARNLKNDGELHLVNALT